MIRELVDKRFEISTKFLNNTSMLQRNSVFGLASVLNPQSQNLLLADKDPSSISGIHSLKPYKFIKNRELSLLKTKVYK